MDGVGAVTSQLLGLCPNLRTAAMFRQQAKPRGAGREFIERRRDETCGRFFGIEPGVLKCLLRPYRLTVRTAPFHGVNRGSIPRGVTMTRTPLHFHGGVSRIIGPTNGTAQDHAPERRAQYHGGHPLTAAVHLLDISENISKGLAERVPSRSSPFHGVNRGSIPRGVTKAGNIKEVDCSTSFRFCEDGALRSQQAESRVRG